ncbi:rhodanese-like domain-containing protein [Bacillus alkalicellulosilyticus]|uniref:rhodanese-like domain-containing protein n=1 Tax=Alkalihalobacterium alkalicellulosilyticum TaxID=1912214 RepID=UPI00099731E2|nr:rhodanese-like domain-containing protein [Bacillus alkalicellulosilyticus]
MSYEVDGIPQIDFKQLEELVKDNKTNKIIIDVREPDEYEEAHIPNVPLLSMRNFPMVIEELDKEKEYVFVCRSGGRSQNVALFCKENGLQHVTNYSGGMLSWQGETKSGLEKVITDVKELYK